MIIKIFKLLLITTSLLITLSVIGLSWIMVSTEKSQYSELDTLPYNKVGLIPGCNKYVSDGVENIYYNQRIEAGVKLYNLGKIDYILVSGDNAHASYDEPREMKKSLMEAGIPKDKIYSDYAGFRTLDTIVRAKEVFQLNELTLISQSFQNVRGVFIGKNKEINIAAYNVDGINKDTSYKIEIREIFAKIKMLLDLYIMNTEPKFLGDKITIY